jgi:DNA-binding transcriptional LysR family regulator
MPVELRLIEHALAVGRHGNFARAADELGLTQPTLSRSVAALERLLGVTLFDRTTKGVVPTAFGRVVVERGASVLQREADLRQEINALAGLESGTLAVSAGPYPAETFVATAVGRLSRAYPRLAIRFLAADPAMIVRDVLAERIDVGIANVSGLDREPRLVVEPLRARRLLFACRPDHPLTREPALSLPRILAYPLVTTLLRGQVAALAATAGASAAADAPDHVPQILVNSVALGLGVVRASDAIFPAPHAHLAQDLAAGRLVTLDFDVPVSSPPGIILLRDRTPSPAARAFIDILRVTEAEAPLGDAASARRRQRPSAKRSARQ